MVLENQVALMNQRVLNALLIAVSFTQFVPAAIAADSGKVLLADSSTGTGIDMTLHRSSRWQLPSCGALKAPEAPKSAKEEVEEEFPTPASVEAAEKKAALAKKTGRTAATTAAAQPAASVNAVAVKSPSAPAAVKFIAPAAVAAPASRSASSQEGTIMRLTITPGEQDKEEPVPPQVKPRRVIPTTTASAPLPGRNDSVSRMPSSPASSLNRPAVPNSNQMPAFTPPSRSGAPVPGGGIPENPAVRNPGKTAAKGNNQA